MPISFDETYKFDYDSGRGVILEIGAYNQNSPLTFLCY
jgi:hypothetical protein